jgi:uncharacterized membrane protein YcaP (DUF421 family)
MHLMSSGYAAFLAAIATRTVVVMVFLALGLRLLGKRQIGQMNLFDLALIMLLANAVQNAMTNGNGNLSVGIVSASALLIAGRTLTAFILRNPKLEKHVIGSPSILVNEGKFVKDHMKREHISEEQVLAAMRSHAICELSEVAMAVLEVDGTISIVPCESEQHRTKKRVAHFRKTGT